MPTPPADKPSDTASAPDKPDSAAARRRRLAQALRANLKRRKVQASARAAREDAGDVTGSEGRGESGES